MKGKLIVFEGISGTGKETQAKLLKKYLLSRGIISHIVFHPSPSLKPKLRKATVSEQIQLLVADRADRVKHFIIPALSRGEWVISLRNWVSAQVYQGDGESVKKVDLLPDWLFYFDIAPYGAMQRIESRGETRGMYETMKLLNEKRKKYKEVLKNIPHITIDAGQSIDDIAANVLKYIR